MREKAGMGPRAMIMTLAAGLLLLILVWPAGALSPAAVSVAASNSTSVALLDDGTVWQWGYGPGGVWATPHQVGISGVRQVAAGYGHVLALKSDGSVWAWGSNAHGQLGDGTYNDSAGPVQADISGVKAIAAGKDHSLALKSDGTVWAWGYNSYGQVGQGSLNYEGSATPVPVGGLNGIKAIAAGGSHCLALDSNNVLWGWGENIHGVLGDGTNESRFTPVPTKANDVKDFSAGASHTLAARSDGGVWAWGYNYMGQLGTGDKSPRDQGRVSFGPEVDHYSPGAVTGIPDVKAVAAGASHSVALKNDGTVWAWGNNEDGQLGSGAVGGSDMASPAQVEGIDGVTAIAAGMYHTLALKSDGGVWAWGSDEYGQIGNDSVSSTASPVLVLIGPQVVPPASPTPVIATVPPATATPGPEGPNYTFIGAIGLLVVILIVVVAACLLVLRNKMKKDKSKKEQ